MDVGAFLVANAQAAELVEPSERALHRPAPSSQSVAVLSVSLHEPRHDTAGSQTLPDSLRVITTVAQQAIRTMARVPSLSL